ncbi:MAG: DinB family protein [Alphaproteobacteria bacterium]|nr:DinB family protein [Alphaproteobacteria bacterium]
MTDPRRSFIKLAYNNRLANERLHEAVSMLQPGEFEAPRTGFFPSIRASLNHILVIDWFYVDALEGGRLGPKAWANEIPFPHPEGLREAQAAVDQRLLNFCLSLDIDALASEVQIHRGTRVQTERVDDVLNHLFQHQTHHRGQVHAMLSGTSVPPPQLDEFIVSDDAASRAAEMQQLSITEADLMMLDRSA